MKVDPRPTAKRVVARRITAPETRVDENSGKKIALLSFINGGSYMEHLPTTKDLFLYAAGRNEPGEEPDGLDRQMNFTYTVHVNESGKAVGLDIIPDRLYRSGVIPVSQKDVKTITLQYDLNGAVVRVVKWPFNTRAEQFKAVILELDKIVATGKTITSGMRLGRLGSVIGTTGNQVEVKLNAKGGDQTRDAGEDLDEVSGFDDIAEDAGAAAVTE